MALLPFCNPGLIEAGCDEAGRGCLAGPVFAAAVIFPAGFSHSGLNDSKKLGSESRKQFRILIENEAISWAVSMCSPQEIDEMNILNASFLAMHRAIDQLSVKPEHLLIDGNRFRSYPGIPHTCIVKGDGKYLSVAAASILAKTYRDEHMEKLHELFPQYNWKNNKAYPTPAHRRAIFENGISIHHRKTFQLVNTQQKIEFRHGDVSEGTIRKNGAV